MNLQHFFEMFLWALEIFSLAENREEKKINSSEMISGGIQAFFYSFNDCIPIVGLTYSVAWYI